MKEDGGMGGVRKDEERRRGMKMRRRRIKKIEKKR